MNELLEMLNLRWEHLLARSSGPLHFRFLTMPIVVSIHAIRAGLRDAREGRSLFLWTFLSRPAERRGLFQSALKDIRPILIMAVALDTTYQLLVLKAFYPGELLLVVVVSAVLPYLLLRGPVSIATGYLSSRMMGGSWGKKSH